MLLDAPLPFRLGFQDSATTISTGIVYMHDKILYYLTLVLFLVLYLILRILTNFNRATNFYIKRSVVEKGSIHGKLIELVWTITPAHREWVLQFVYGSSIRSVLYLVNNIPAIPSTAGASCKPKPKPRCWVESDSVFAGVLFQWSAMQTLRWGKVAISCCSVDIIVSCSIYVVY